MHTEHALPLLSPIVAGMWRMAEWNLDVAARVRWIEQALELGIHTFDHADIYGNHEVESLFGAALKAAPSLRERMRIVTKCGIRLTSAQRGVAVQHYDTSPAHVRAQVEASLRKLHVERLDLVLIHRPDYLMDATALAETFAALTDEGKVAHWGVSNHTVDQFALLDARHALRTNQVELSPLHLAALDDGTLDQAQRLGRRPMIWSPLGGGRLFTGEDAQAVRVRGVMQPMAERLGVSLATLAYAWILRHPSRPHPITGSGRIEGLREAVAALDVTLSAEDWYTIWTASTGHPVP
ncbi:aldo/keto reductase [Oleiagrimonas soli]|uniref:Oxidoreductase n=1 Tax=Oleiagrimonas soli TaxID=1543381 RepID=A0A099CVQ0_9GAMM|nr:aldo/keto reductase [Oleiagrimonas soli]KGI77095.1 oxidoreductase [Oleiagrimonas soli]MBB6185371.1 putative oxidoreductase [Oleiagrimonas soli]